MQVYHPNNINIYDLSHGKSLPEFISERKRRTLLKKDSDLQRRIELIQDFDMPTVSKSIKMSSDQQYIYASGTYKPRVRCYDVKDLSMKFERCLDSEIITFSILSDDYSKVVFLLEDRNVELHTAYGVHFKIRFPKFGRDMAYHSSSCDLLMVGAGSEIYRLNLDQGRFLKSFDTNCSELTKCVINETHNFIMVGSVNGHVECWDPRSKSRVGILNCSQGLLSFKIKKSPGISSLNFKDPLHLAVGTSSGQVLLYDIRGNRPYVTKDHHYELPIHSIAFSLGNDVVISADRCAVKLWKEQTGEAITAVEMQTEINDMHVVKDTGLLFLANESPKIHTYFIPFLGAAPKWCSFLDNLTGELEENPVPQIYDDYKFITPKELESLGLSNLIGSNLLRAYMHGYFIHMKLYDKAVSVSNPFAYKEYRRKKIAEKMDEALKNRIDLKKLPKVNRKLAERLNNLAEMQVTNTKKKQQKKVASELLADTRFNAIFENPDYQVDENSDEYLAIYQKNRKQAKKAEEKADSKFEIEEDEFSSSEDEKDGALKWIKDNNKAGGSTSDSLRLFTIKDEVQQASRFNTLHDLEQLSKNLNTDCRKKSLTIADRIKDIDKNKVEKKASKSKCAEKISFKTTGKNKKIKKELRKHRPISRVMRNSSK